MSKKCKKVLIFTLIFTLKTNMSYKVTIFATANHPIFKISLKNLLFLNFFLFFVLFFPFAFSFLTFTSTLFPDD